MATDRPTTLGGDTLAWACNRPSSASTCSPTSAGALAARPPTRSWPLLSCPAPPTDRMEAGQESELITTWGTAREAQVSEFASLAPGTVCMVIRPGLSAATSAAVLGFLWLSVEL